MFWKKAIWRITLIVSIIFLSSCKRPESQPSKDDPDINGNNSDESQPIQQENPCDNIFYPLSIDNQWTYQARLEDENESAEIRELKFSVVGIDDTSADIELLDQPTGLITKSTANCDNGSITNFPVTKVDMSIGEVSVDVSLEYIEGIFMPSKADFEAENWTNTWDTSYTASGSLQGSFENEPITIALSSSPATISWQVLDTSYDIEVPAGKFSDVVLISRKISMDVTSLQTVFSGKNIDISTTINVTSNMWFAPHTGLVKQELDSVTINFFGFDYPLESSGKIDLISTSIN